MNGCKVGHLLVTAREAFGEMTVTRSEGLPEPVEQKGLVRLRVALDEFERADLYAYRADVRRPTSRGCERDHGLVAAAARTNAVEFFRASKFCSCNGSGRWNCVAMVSVY